MFALRELIRHACDYSIDVYKSIPGGEGKQYIFDSFGVRKKEIMLSHQFLLKLAHFLLNLC